MFKMDDIDFGNLMKHLLYRLFTVEINWNPNDILNVNGGSIAIGHPYRNRIRLVGILIEGKEEKPKMLL